ncbi:DUF1236 domain-containing protein [Methylocystis parvus]|nr:DUF1236 domain-containing protein [Methylocystis parvus]WBK00378.1 DUF1236 domain-containing protein [Methylocystis parvus OBBP]
MRARLLLSVAAATLSLCLFPAYAQQAGRDPDAGGGAATMQRSGEPDSAGKVTSEQSGERAAQQGKAEADRPGVAEPSRTGRHKAGRGAKANKSQEKHGVIEENRDRAAERDMQQEPAGRPSASGETDRQDLTRSAGPRDERMTTEGPESARGADQAGATATARDRQERGAARLSRGDQRRVREAIERKGGRSFSHDEFDVRIGAVAPPNVQFYPLPPEIAGIAPQFRGYQFVRVEDDIAIVDPNTRRVIAMLDEERPTATYGYEEGEGGYRGDNDRRERGRFGAAERDEGRYAEGRRGRGETYGYAPRVRLDARQERSLYRSAMRDARASLRQVCLHVDDRVPEFVDIDPVPRQVAADAPDVERYDYFVLNDDVVLVDPDTRRVVDIIEGR